MIWLSPAAPAPEGYGYIASPAGQVGAQHLTVPWACDNQVFTKKYDHYKFFNWLRRVTPWRPWCLFVVVPDAVADRETTLRQWPHFAGAIKRLGYPAAFAAQDGMTPDDIPADADALFVGGSDRWKLHPPCVEMIRAAQARGMWVHVGRVQSQERIGHCVSLGVDSSDGTFTIYGPDKNWPKLQARMGQKVMF